LVTINTGDVTAENAKPIRDEFENVETSVTDDGEEAKQAANRVS